MSIELIIREKRNPEYMNLHNKTFMELNKDELQREIDYLFGQYDYVSTCEYLPKDVRLKKARYLWDEIDALSTRYLLLSLEGIQTSMQNICKEMKDLRK